jgi:hypothetical protein
MKAKSIKGNSPEEIKTEVIRSRADDFVPTLAIVFMSVHLDREAVSQVLADVGISVYGATTNGEFIDEEIGKNSIAILLLDINRDYFMIMSEAYPEKNYREITQHMARHAIEKFATPAFLISGSHMETDAEQLLFGFEDIVGKQVNVFGCMAGDDFTFVDQYVFTNGWSSNRGIVALVLDESKIMIKGIATCGWKAMGTEKTVTRSEGNRVYTIENIPVLELTQKYSGIENLNKDNSQLIMEIATQFPLQLQREKGAPVMRPGLVVNWEDGSFICSGSIPQGAKIRFSLPPDLDVIDKVVEGLEQLKETEMPDGDAVIVYSCAGRLMSLGPLMSKEIEGVKKVYNLPMAGMFSNSELARATDGNLEMNNLTTCCVVLKEK